MRASPSRKRRRYSSSNVRNSKPCHLQVGQLYRLWRGIVSCDTLRDTPRLEGDQEVRNTGSDFFDAAQASRLSRRGALERPFFVPLSCVPAKCNEGQGFLWPVSPW